MRLYLVRHCAPSAAPGICYGRTDLPVDPAEHERMLPGLRASLPPDSGLFSSPLQRCTQLARQLPCTSLSIDARLAELDFGSWEMRSWDDIARSEIDAWAADVVHYRPGGGESVFDMALRVHDFHQDLVRSASESAIVVCHAGTMRLLAACRSGAAPLEMAREAAREPHRIGYGEVVMLAGE